MSHPAPAKVAALVPTRGFDSSAVFLPHCLAGDESQSGISGQPKVFDNRLLVSMQELLVDSLRSIQCVNKADLAAAVNSSQGSQISDTSRFLEITAIPTPQIVTDASATRGIFAPTKQTTTARPVTPKPPATDTSNGTLPDAVTKKDGVATVDLLNEQMDLTYQIFNLRMLLARSLSDRNVDSKPSLQSVLGSQISLDPPQKYKGCPAVVEIRVLPPDNSTKSVSLEAMMPQEKRTTLQP